MASSHPFNPSPPNPDRQKFIDDAAIAQWAAAEDRSEGTARMCFDWAEKLWRAREINVLGRSVASPIADVAELKTIIRLLLDALESDLTATQYFDSRIVDRAKKAVGYPSKAA